MNYAIITENDESPWEDITGIQYHFPSRYLKIIPINNSNIPFQLFVGLKCDEVNKL